MLTQQELQAKFGEWVAPFAAAMEPLLRCYESTRCYVSLVHSSMQHEAHLTIRLNRNAVPGEWLSSSTLARLRGESPAFKRQCVDATCELFTKAGQLCLRLEFVFVNASALTTAQLDDRHRQATWAPDASMLRALKANCESQFDGFVKHCHHLTPESKAKVVNLLQLYCVSTEKAPAPKLAFVPDKPDTLVISNVKHTKLSWWTYLLQQLPLGISEVTLQDSDLVLLLDPPLQLQEARTCRPSKPSFLSRVRRWSPF